MLKVLNRICSAPIDVVVAEFDEAVEGRLRIIAHPSYKAVLAGVPVDVISTAVEVIFVADHVFVKTSLRIVRIASRRQVLAHGLVRNRRR